ncbi:MAG: hypothetical protein ACK5LX_12065 [Oscillospiraceae bacterium]
MATKLFGNNITPACKYCEHTLRVLAKNNQVLCGKYGVVRTDHKCRHFVYDPLWRVPPKPRAMQTFTGTEFSL